MQKVMEAVIPLFRDVLAWHGHAGTEIRGTARHGKGWHGKGLARHGTAREGLGTARHGKTLARHGPLAPGPMGPWAQGPLGPWAHGTAWHGTVMARPWHGTARPWHVSYMARHGTSLRNRLAESGG